MSMMPGLRGTAARPFGSSWARARVRPSIAHFEAQYGATSGETERPQYELRLTITPDSRAIIAGTTWRRTLATPLMFTSMRRSNSSAGTSQVGALWLIRAALLISRSGAPDAARNRLAQAFTRSSRDVHCFEVTRCAQGRAEHLDRPGVPTAADDRVPEPGEALGQGPPEAPRRPRDHDPFV